MQQESRCLLSRSSPLIEPINDMLSHWSDFALYAEDGRVCMTNKAAGENLVLCRFQSQSCVVTLTLPFSDINGCSTPTNTP
ncbi:hypothetical protein RLEG3_04430 (plasmid) [Rhizobium leguminosarum bv. trifolii WSM1689]|nr:hypothetical protein [Rhizobium leguminosarum]AHF87501.1 hypothetical protein RLEG3_04430 [Rhizobium leguminosarum bv. trifolii WSM1689]MBY5661040.1 hypothetical protein [Rhizobium leguminosarum]MBY5674504.1 hypothetical protein [Rhizobium leguminosarum]MBY5738089.1 hypothetical protein [Rhizobium leguminosarum]